MRGVWTSLWALALAPDTSPFRALEPITGGWYFPPGASSRSQSARCLKSRLGTAMSFRLRAR